MWVVVPPPKRGRSVIMEVEIMRRVPLGPTVKISSEGGEDDIRVVCDGGSGFPVGRLHGKGRAARGLWGPLRILKVVISSKVSVANAFRLSRASWARPLRCPWPAVVECPMGRQSRSSVRIPPEGSMLGRYVG